MWTRRKLLERGGLAFLIGSFTNLPIFWNFISTSWAKAKQLLPKGFPKDQMINMNPAEIDNRDLEIDPLDKFGTMGPTDVDVDIKTYRLKITGKVKQPLSLTYDEILKYPSLTETVLLICPGFFINNGRWSGVSFRTLLKNANVHQEAKYLDVKGAYGKVVRISLKDIDRKRVFLAFRINGEPLPQKHGFPLRLVYEDAYGYDWVKYVEEIVIS
ncbi:MAG: molybdopterin-dependent oxidoreductase [Desulfobacterales bacterium]|nr:molybdopterin-dependent oxidoreductase [Desulfobacterales bacterium]